MKKIKKGFTLVELLVVIAILAILATVSTITYFVFVNSAKQSADEQAVTQMNIALEAQQALNAPKNVEEAKDVLEDAGFNVSDYVPLNKNYIFYYDSSEIRVLIFDQEQEKVTFPENLAEKYKNVSEKLGSWWTLNDNVYVWNTLEGLTGDISEDSVTFKNALVNANNNESVRLDSDLTVNNNFFDNGTLYNDKGIPYQANYFPTNKNGVANIDLNGHVLTIQSASYVGGFTGSFQIHEPTIANINISNGTIKGVSPTSCFNVETNSSLNLDKVTFINEDDSNDTNAFSVESYAKLTISDSTIKAGNGDTCSVFLGGDQSEVNIFNSTLESASYGISTNASGDQSWNVRLNVSNSSIKTNNGSGVLVNVPGQYMFSDSNISGNGIGVAIRGGNANFENCVIEESGDNTKFRDLGLSAEFSLSPVAGTPFANKGQWASGDAIQYGGLIVGDWAANYGYNSNVTLQNTEIHMNDIWSDLPIVYLSQDSGFKTDFNYDSESRFYNNSTSTTPAELAIKVNSANYVDAGLTEGFVNINKI